MSITTRGPRSRDSRGSSRSGPWRSVLALAAFTLPAALTSCGLPEEVVLEASSIVEDAKPLKLRTMMETHGLRSSRESKPAPRAFAYELPAGWREQAKTQYRSLVNLRFGPERDPGECYLVQLPGGGGPLADNVNRWRNQLGQPPLGREGIAALERRKIVGLGVEAVVVDLRGTYSGMQGKPRPAQRFLGLIWQQGGVGHYLVCVGPDELVTSSFDDFERVVSSLAPKEPEARPKRSRLADLRASIAFDLPKTWREAPERSMRILNFWVGEGERAYCYLSQAGGSLSDNVNRWRKQLGEKPLDSAAIGALATVRVLSVDAKIVDAKGDFGGGMGSKPIQDAQLVGAIAKIPGATLFVKMLGPRSIVEKERENFLSFCKSLRATGGAAASRSANATKKPANAAKKSDEDK